jgi:hypothetical protein
MGSVVFHHPLPRSIPIVDREHFILEKCKGQRVVHRGCADEGLIDEKLQAGDLLHSRIAKVAAWLAGVDRDEEGIRKLKAAHVGDLNICLDVTELDDDSCHATSEARIRGVRLVLVHESGDEFPRMAGGSGAWRESAGRCHGQRTCGRADAGCCDWL